MKKEVKSRIPNPCFRNIDEMAIGENDKIRFCKSCKSNVYDIRSFSEEEIINLKKSKNDNICVIANSEQLSKSNRIKKIALASFVIFSSFFSNEINAQYKSKLSSFEIKQSLIPTDSIQFSGFVYIKKTFGWKKISDYEIDVYRDGKLIENEIIKNSHKKFLIQYEFEPYENITLVIRYKGYKEITLKNIRFANTKIRVYLEPKRPPIVGRYF